jgi:hypothetical protein
MTSCGRETSLTVGPPDVLDLKRFFKRVVGLITFVAVRISYGMGLGTWDSVP